MSPWRSRAKPTVGTNAEETDTVAGRQPPSAAVSNQRFQSPASTTESSEKKGMWSWKPMRALARIGMHRLGCLFSVEVVSVQNLLPSMNGLRLSVYVRKKETKEGAVETMPARVLQGTADFEETLFIRCHVYCSGGGSSGKPLKLEPRPFLISVFAIEAPELDFGRSSVDLSQLVKESMAKSLEGERIRQWDAGFQLSGKAKGGELVIKLGFQIMEDSGVGLYNQAENLKGKESSSSSSLMARKQSKTSFSVSSPRLTARSEPFSTPSKELAMSNLDLNAIDEFILDGPAQPPELENKVDDFEIPDFEVVDKGVELQSEKEVEEQKTAEEESLSSEVVKEVVHHTRLTELDEIAKQIKLLESMIGEGLESIKVAEKVEEGAKPLDDEEETVRREFLQMLENEEPQFGKQDLTFMKEEEEEDDEAKIFLSDLGKGLGPVVQTRDGGYLAAMNPLDVEVNRRDSPKLAMQLSKPFILVDKVSATGFEVFQKLAAIGAAGLCSKLLSLAAMDDLMMRTAEQIAFEGMASTIISGRNRDGASSRASKSIANLRSMAIAMNEGRRERIKTGISKALEKTITIDKVFASLLQKIESMMVEAMKVQADMSEEAPPFEISPTTSKKEEPSLLESIYSIDDLMNESFNRKLTTSSVTLLVVVQLRDPLRRYEAVGGPSISLAQLMKVPGDDDEEEEKFKVTSLHVGGLKNRVGGDKQRLTAMQWLVAYGLGRAASTAAVKKTKGAAAANSVFWSLSSRVMADMWLKPTRNPDVKMDQS